MPHLKAQYITTSQEHSGRRLDNFLLTQIKGVPRSHIYYIIRSGQVRVNSKRIKPLYRLDCGDEIRIPPLRRTAVSQLTPPTKLYNLIKNSIIYQDEQIILLNKPANISVHGGIKQKYGIIEILKSDHSDLYLVHRLDSAATGCLLLARNIDTLRKLQRAWDRCQKVYHLLVEGHWPAKEKLIESQIKKVYRSGEYVMTGRGKEKIGQYAATQFSLIGYGSTYSLVQARLITGRTHQIRCHCSELGHPIIGDQKYASKSGKTLALHAYQLTLADKILVNQRDFTAPYPMIFNQYPITDYV